MARPHNWMKLAALGVVLAVGGTGLTSASPAAATPKLSVSTVVSGLSIPWDLTWVGDLMLFDQRGGSVWSRRGTAAPKRVSIPLPPLYVSSEAGLLGMVADPGAATNGNFYTCQAVANNGRPDVRVLRWHLTSDTQAVSGGSPVVTGLPTTSGRHSGCRLRFGPNGLLYIGTGDAATGTNPQNRQSLGGKVLRVASDGTIPTDNPFYGEGGNARYIWTYGHRNVQGVAFRPGTTELWNAEQGTGRDDEVNLDVAGANYGWDPVPGYDESTPMTDKRKFPKAVSAKWSSGNPTVATSGLTFLSNPAWGYWRGAMAVGILKDTGIMILILDPAGRVVGEGRIPGLSGYGRIRTTQEGPDGSLYFTTSNGSNDKIGRITPVAPVPNLPAGQDVGSSRVSAADDGSTLSVAIRTTRDRIFFNRSTNRGASWQPTFVSAGISSVSPPSITAGADGRIDLVTSSAAGEVVHGTYLNQVKQDQETLPGEGEYGSPAIATLGGGTLDVLALGRDGTVARQHYDGTRWSGWRPLTGATFTSTVGIAADPTNGTLLLTARGTDGSVYERQISATDDGAGWTQVPGVLWSGRALGDRFASAAAAVSVSRAADNYVQLQRGPQAQGLRMKITSDPDVVTRADGTFVVFGRGTDQALHLYDGRPGAWADRRIGGTLT